MASEFDRPNRGGDEPPQSQRRPNIQDVIAHCRRILSAGNHDTDFAETFVQHIAAPELRYEFPRLVTTIGGGNRWEYAYQVRVAESLTTWIGMNDAERKMLMAGIQEEQVPWRGESLPVYLKIVDETLRMREVGRDAYIQNAKQALNAISARA